MSYTPINWNNNTTPINETNLNKMDQAIAGLSDEVDAVEEKVGKLKYEWTANIKCATWSRLCYVERLTVYDCSYLIQLSFSRSGGVIVTDTFLVTAMGSGYGSIVKVCGNNYGTLEYSVRIILNSAGDGYFEIYDDMGGVTSDTTQTIRCSLIPIATRDIATLTAWTDGTTISDGYRVVKVMKVTKTDFQSDVTDAINSRLAYKAIAGFINPGDTGCSASAYTENGLVHVYLTVPQGASGLISVSISNEVYYPRSPVGGTFASLSSSQDAGKLSGYATNVGKISIYASSALTATEALTFVYPLKSS